MTFLADENIDQEIIDRLRRDGYVVLAVAEMAPSIDDDTVLRLANERDAILLTADKDFGELVFRQRRVSTGVVLIRLAGLQATAKASLVAAAISRHAGEIRNTFTVIAPGSIRIRRDVL